ncbi:MAG: hypothetical protein V4507_03185 [Verrucomicrobiota bacterium]
MDMSQEKLQERQKAAADAEAQAAKPVPSTRVAEPVIPQQSSAPAASSPAPTPTPSDVIESQRRAFSGILTRR